MPEGEAPAAGSAPRIVTRPILIPQPAAARRCRDVVTWRCWKVSSRATQARWVWPLGSVARSRGL